MRSTWGCLSSRPSRAPWAPVAFAILSATLTAQPASAQDCSIGRDDWDDIQRFRNCIEEYGLGPGLPGFSTQAASVDYQTDRSCVSSCSLPPDPNASDDNALTLLHEASRPTHAKEKSHFLNVGAEMDGRDNEGSRRRIGAAARSGNGRPAKVLPVRPLRRQPTHEHQEKDPN